MSSFEENKIPTPVKVAGAAIAGLLVVGGMVGLFTGGGDDSLSDPGFSDRIEFEDTAPDSEVDLTPESDLVPETDYAQVRVRDVERFLAASNTFSWDWPVDRFVNDTIAAGAVPGSNATRPPYSGQSLALCIDDRCSIKPTGQVDGVEFAKDRSSVSATIFVSFRINENDAVPMPLFCDVTIARGENVKAGLFTDVTCLASSF